MTSSHHKASGVTRNRGLIDKIVSAPIAPTFRDYILLPGWTTVEPQDVNLSTQLTIDHRLAIPITSAPMDTVTESEMAIAMAQVGGVGVLHRNCTSTEQVEMARKLKEAPIKTPRSKHWPSGAATGVDGRLLCAAAVSPFDLDRAKKLGRIADVLVTDVAHFHNANVFSATRRLLKEVDSSIIVGNIGTYWAAVDVLTKLEDVAGLRVGVGSGTTCVTTDVTGVAAPTIFAAASAVAALEEYAGKMPVIADGGIKSAADVAVALSVGASTIMTGFLLAGCSESCGELVTVDGREYKRYRGMGSSSSRAKRLSLDRYSQPSKDIVEGVEGLVPHKGTVPAVVGEIASALKAAMGYVGAKDIPSMMKKARLARVTAQGLEELGPHGLILRSDL